MVCEVLSMMFADGILLPLITSQKELIPSFLLSPSLVWSITTPVYFTCVMSFETMCSLRWYILCLGSDHQCHSPGFLKLPLSRWLPLLWGLSQSSCVACIIHVTKFLFRFLASTVTLSLSIFCFVFFFFYLTMLGLRACGIFSLCCSGGVFSCSVWGL